MRGTLGGKAGSGRANGPTKLSPVACSTGCLSRRIEGGEITLLGMNGDGQALCSSSLLKYVTLDECWEYVNEIKQEQRITSYTPGRPVKVYNHLGHHVALVAGINASEAVASRLLGPKHNGATYREGAWHGNPPSNQKPNPPRGGGPAVSSLQHRASLLASLNNAKPKRCI